MLFPWISSWKKRFLLDGRCWFLNKSQILYRTWLFCLSTGWMLRCGWSQWLSLLTTTTSNTMQRYSHWESFLSRMRWWVNLVLWRKNRLGGWAGHDSLLRSRKFSLITPSLWWRNHSSSLRHFSIIKQFSVQCHRDKGNVKITPFLVLPHARD